MKEIILSEEIQEKLKAVGVALTYFFGSRADGSALEKSDYDIGIVFVDRVAMEIGGTGLYLRVYDILSDITGDTPHGPRLDISFLQKANPVLQMKAMREGKILFEISPAFRADYEEGVVRDYNDYIPLKKEFEEATIRAFQ